MAFNDEGIWVPGGCGTHTIKIIGHSVTYRIGISKKINKFSVLTH